MKNKIIISILIMIVGYITTFQLIEYYKIECLYYDLHSIENNYEVQLALKKDFRIQSVKWVKNNIRNFNHISPNDSITPFIINSNNSKAIFYYVQFSETLTTFKQINSIYKDGSWQFTMNGTLNHIFSKYENNKESYEINFKQLLIKFYDLGYLKPLSCDLNNKIFNEFTFYSMEKY